LKVRDREVVGVVRYEGGEEGADPRGEEAGREDGGGEEEEKAETEVVPGVSGSEGV